MALLYHRVEFAKLGVWIIATTQTPWLLHGNLINLFTTKLYIAFPSVAER